MSDKKHTVTEEIETTMACSAFGEAGEPCPIDGGEEETHKAKNATPANGESMVDKVEDDFACTAFSDQNEECPIGKDRK